MSLTTKTRLISLLVPLATAPSSSARAAVSQADAAAKISASIQADGKLAEVRLQIPDGIKFNMDGPWNLTLTGPIVEKGKAAQQFKRDAFKDERHSFSIPLAAQPPRAELAGSRWNLTYFLCNQTATWCKRLTASGIFELP
jgi:hypothetical protein